jgi:hypothetical protein
MRLEMSPGPEQPKEIARRLGLSEDDPNILRDMEALADGNAAALTADDAPKPRRAEWGLKAARAAGDRQTGKANRLAVAALICACVAPVFVVGALGIVFGLVELDEIEDSEGAEHGTGIA